MNLKPKVRYTCLRKKIYLGPLFETVKSEKGICIPICLKLFAYMQNKPN